MYKAVYSAQSLELMYKAVYSTQSLELRYKAVYSTQSLELRYKAVYSALSLELRALYTSIPSVPDHCDTIFTSPAFSHTSPNTRILQINKYTPLSRARGVFIQTNICNNRRVVELSKG